MMKHLILIILSLMILGPAAQAQETVYDNYKAVILAYYRIGEDRYPASNLRKDQFENHIREILSGNYTVLPIPGILKKIKNGEQLPENTLGLSFQGGFHSVLQNAAPLLFEHSLPFTIFFASETIGNPQYLSWKDIKFLAKNPNVTLGIMPAEYAEISRQSQEERQRNLNKARLAFRENMKSEPELFAYPFGEFDADYQKLVTAQNMLGAFGLQSGPVYENSDFLALPRFVMTENFGDLERFKIVTSTLPLPAQDIEPPTSMIENLTANVGFTIPENMQALIEKLNCYSSNQGKIPIEILGERRIELRPDLVLSERTRINCTAAVPTGINDLAYRWLGFLLSPNISNTQQGEPPEPQE